MNYLVLNHVEEVNRKVGIYKHIIFMWNKGNDDNKNRLSL